jgi:hypothetical protein
MAKQILFDYKIISLKEFFIKIKSDVSRIKYLISEVSKLHEFAMFIVVSILSPVKIQN